MSGRAQRPQRFVLEMANRDHIFELDCRRARDDVQFLPELVTIMVEWQIIDVVSERVLELVPDGREPIMMYAATTVPGMVIQPSVP